MASSQRDWNECCKRRSIILASITCSKSLVDLSRLRSTESLLGGFFMPAAALDSAVLSFRKISLLSHTKSIVNNLTRWAEYIVVLMITFRLVQQRRATSGYNSRRQHNSNPELIGLN